MRAYFFGNMYLSSIQQGIQAAHVTAEMFIKYPATASNSKAHEFWNWATRDKTMILLNAGYSEELLKLETFFKSNKNPYHWASFRESKEALNNSITSVGIILPARIYDEIKTINQFQSLEDFEDNYGEEFSQWEYDLMNKIHNYSLAR